MKQQKTINKHSQHQSIIENDKNSTLIKTQTPNKANHKNIKTNKSTKLKTNASTTYKTCNTKQSNTYQNKNNALPQSTITRIKKHPQYTYIYMQTKKTFKPHKAINQTITTIKMEKKHSKKQTNQIKRHTRNTNTHTEEITTTTIKHI